MLKIISVIAWINLLIGLPSVLLVVNLRSLSLIATGMLSLNTYWLLRVTIKHISQSKNWGEIMVLAMCCVYFPAFIVWISGANLIEAILR